MRLGRGAREIGYWLIPPSAGQGYALEAAAAMVRVAIEVDGVDRLEIRCAPANRPSAAVPVRLGFTHEATLKRRFEDSEGQPHDSMVWILFTSDYARSPARGIHVRAFDCMHRQIL